jgi:alpha-mannosidase
MSDRARIEEIVRGVVRPAIYPMTAPLDVTAHHVHGEPITVSDATARSFEPFAVGDAWGPAWDTTWFRFTGTVPDAWAGSDVVARVELGAGVGPGFSAEALIWRDGAPVHGVHRLHTDHVIGRPARGGEGVDLLVEAAANPTPPFQLREWPLLEADPHGEPIYVLKRAELAIVDREVEALWFDLRILTQLLDRLPEGERQREIGDALLAAASAIDSNGVGASARAAREILATVLSKRSSHPHLITAVGHAHIDTAWLWPLRETIRKCARSFSNQLALMDDYPEHRFVCSQAQQYEWMKEHYPTIWEGIKQCVAEGRWEPVGGMWVEPDSNVPSGEALVRQVTFGSRFFAEEFGVDSDELWVPDIFGYSAALPQIATRAGMRALITQKLSWNDTNTFPYTTFWWEGLDGSRILTHFPPADTYNGVVTIDEIAQSVERKKGHGACERSLYPFGFGDGGGGPNRYMLEFARRIADLDGLPRTEIGTVDGFLDDVLAASDDLGVWAGELYLEYHRGTYTTQAATKLGNRRGEEALREAEMWSVAACVARGDWSAYPQDELERAWKLLLLNQFHDILPGSSIHWVYEDARRDYATILEIAAAAIEDAQRTLAGDGDGITLFNPSSSRRRELVDIPGRGATMVDIPACSWGPVVAAPEPEPITVRGSTMENEHLRITWDDRALLTSVYDKDADREVLAGPGNVFQIHEDNPKAYDAWDVDLEYLDTVTDITDVDAIEVVGGGPLRAEVRFTRTFGGSSISQTMRLDAGSRRLEFHTDVDWHEHHRFLKVAFPVDVRSSTATYEIQHGHLERPTVRNTSWDVARFEVSAHRWADLSESGYGVALVNDCKYGYDIHRNVMRLSLLRAPGWPDPEADRGHHRFAYALLPHVGDLREAGVIAGAEAFNLPIDVRSGAAGSGTIVAVDRPNVSVEAVKKADREDAIVVRLCEVWGARGPVRVTIGAPVTSATGADLLERDTDELTVTDGVVEITMRPFELVTLKLRT